MKRKKELVIVLTSLLVIVLSVSVAYFTTKILGTEKDISVTSADLKVTFTSGSGEIKGTNIEPGWTSNANTFTVKNESNGTYNYNIVIKDLVNTFTTSGFLVYKITSLDGGYNMTDFENVPKSLTTKDKVLAYNISIDKDATHTYTVEFKYLKSDDVDQSTDMGKTLTGKIFITEGTEKPTLAKQLLNDNPTISIRTDFSKPFISNTVETLYKATENNTDVYYFAGADFVEAHCEYNGEMIKNYGYNNKIKDKEQCQSELTLCLIGDTPYYGHSDCSGNNGTSITTTDGKWIEDIEKPINNWVKFGKYEKDLIKYRGYYKDIWDISSYKDHSTMEECESDEKYNQSCTQMTFAKSGDPIYWRIIRTNSDGSLRLLYSGTSPDTTKGYIGESTFNTYDTFSPKYVGYMYGDTDITLEEARANTNDSTIKSFVDNWYENYFTTYTNYLSSDAVYCNDRELKGDKPYSTGISASDQFYFKAYERLSDNKAPSYDCVNKKDSFSGSNTEAKLKYPIALMTADEMAYVGGVYGQNAPMWYYTNSTYKGIVDSGKWWTITPFGWTGTTSYTESINFVETQRSSGRRLVYTAFFDESFTSNQVSVRPVTSLKSCVQWKSGDGSADNPYEIVENDGC